MDEMKFERGQVYYVRYDDSVGGEMAIGRPVLIISSQEDIEELDTVIVVYLTTGLRKSKNVVEVRLNGKRQYVHCSQVHTMSKTRLRDYQGKLRQTDMLKIDENLCNAQGLSHYICDNRETEVAETLVSVAEPVDIRVVESKEDEVISLKAELEIQKKLYAKAVERIVELQLAKDTRVVVEEKIVEVEKPREMTEEEILAWIDRLGEKCEKAPEKSPKKCEKDVKLSDEEISGMMSQLEEAGLKQPKRGRPVGSKNKTPKTEEVKVPWTAKREDILQYKKPSGKVNMNTDEWYVIAATTGMRLQTAQGICAYRKKYGKFESLVNLLDVPRFGSTMLDKYGHMMEV